MSSQFYSTEFKREVLIAYENRDCSIQEICSRFQIPKITLYDWVEKFEKYGLEGLKKSGTWKEYSKELKKAAVRDYLSGEYSQYEIVRIYEISSRSVLQKWINHYNSYRDLRIRRKKGRAL